MIPDSIEREMTIEAPVEVVWRTITEPREIARWFADEVEIDTQPGGEGALTFRGHDDPVKPFVVESIDPMTTFAFRWCEILSVEPQKPSTLLVTFTLTPDGDRTHLRMVESGFRGMGWDEDFAKAQHDEHIGGWTALLPRLVTVAEAV